MPNVPPDGWETAIGRVRADAAEAFRRIQDRIDRAAGFAQQITALENTQPRTVRLPVPELPAGRHDLDVTWPHELPTGAYRVQITTEAPRAATGQVSVVLLAGSRTTTGCVVILDTAEDIPAEAVWLHVTATP